MYIEFVHVSFDRYDSFLKISLIVGFRDSIRLVFAMLILCFRAELRLFAKFPDAVPFAIILRPGHSSKSFNQNGGNRSTRIRCCGIPRPGQVGVYPRENHPLLFASRALPAASSQRVTFISLMMIAPRERAEAKSIRSAAGPTNPCPFSQSLPPKRTPILVSSSCYILRDLLIISTS